MSWFKPIPFFSLVKREVFNAMRERRSFALMALFVAAVSLVVANGWPEGSFSLNEAAYFSRSYLASGTVLLFLACGLLVPAFAAAAFIIEKQRETLDLLRLTLIHPVGLVMAKLVAAVGFFICLIIAALPVFGAAFFLVGIDPIQWMQVITIVVLTSVTCALIGITVSTRSSSIFKSVALSYVIVVLVHMAAPWMLLIVWTIIWTIPAMLLGTLGFFPDFYSLMQMSSPIVTTAAILDGAILPREFWCAVVSQLAIVAACFYSALHSLLHLSETPKREIHDEKIIDDPVILEARRRMYPFYLIDPLKRKKPIEDGRNPMLVKEIRWGLFGNGTVIARLTYVAVIFYFLFGAGAYFESASFSSMYFWCMSQIVITLLVAPALLANTLTKERELGNVDMLRMTLATPRQIVRGKLMAGLFAMTPFIAASSFSAVVAAVCFHLRQWPLLLTAYTTLAVSCWLCFNLSLFASLFCRRTPTAVALSYFLNFLAFVGVVFVAEVLATRALVYPVPRDIQRLCAFLSPVAAFVANATYSRSSDHSAPHLLTLYWAANITMFVLLCSLLSRIAVDVFARDHMRDR